MNKNQWERFLVILLYKKLYVLLISLYKSLIH